MGVYLLNVIVTGIVGYIAQNQYQKNRVYSHSTSQTAKQQIAFTFVVVLLLLWTFLYARRGISVGTDTGGYVTSFLRRANSDLDFSKVLKGEGDILFELLILICARIAGDSWIFFATVVAFITYIPVLLVLRKEASSVFAFSSLMYIFLLQCYYGYNGMRQAVAISLLFFAYCFFLKEKKYIWYFFFVTIAFGFHSTALFIVPMHFVSRLKLNSKILWCILGALTLSTFSLQSVWNGAISLLEMVGNTTLSERYVNSEYGGSGFLRVAIGLVPLVLGLWQRKLIQAKEKKDISYLYVFLILYTIFMVFSTNNWLFARIASYLEIFIVLYIPKLKNGFSERSRSLAVFLIGGAYFMYMVTLLLYREGGLYPYTFYAG